MSNDGQAGSFVKDKIKQDILEAESRKRKLDKFVEEHKITGEYVKELYKLAKKFGVDVKTPPEAVLKPRIKVGFNNGYKTLITDDPYLWLQEVLDEPGVPFEKIGDGLRHFTAAQLLSDVVMRKAKLIVILRDNPDGLSPREIASEMGLQVQSVNATLQNLRQDGIASSISRGKWQLTSDKLKQELESEQVAA